MSWRHPWYLVLVTAATIVGCSTSARVTQDRFADESASTVCGLLFECGCDVTGFTSEAMCVEEARASAQESLDEALMLGLEYDGACAARELDAYKELGCKTDYEELVPSSLCPCKLFYGPKRAGEACEHLANGFDDCGEQLECLPDPELPMDTCQSSCPFLSGGALCFDIPSQTELGTCNYAQLLYCDTEETGTCRPLGLIGEACPCAPWAFCDPEGPFGPTCVGRRGEGESCLVNFEGQVFAAEVCGEELFCETNGLAEPRCVGFPEAGEPCYQNQCRGEAFCNDSNQCVALGGSGQPCEHDGQCAETHFCDFSVDPDAPVCEALPGDGQPCASNGDCAPGFLCNPFDDVCEEVGALICFGG